MVTVSVMVKEMGYNIGLCVMCIIHGALYIIQFHTFTYNFVLYLAPFCVTCHMISCVLFGYDILCVTCL